MIFFPYRDDNPTRSFPLVNWVIIVANLWVFFAWQLPLSPSGQEAYFAHFGFIPAAFYGQFTVAELSHHTIKRGDSLWKLSRQSDISVPLWLMAKVNPGTDLSVLSVGDTLKVPMLVKNT